MKVKADHWLKHNGVWYGPGQEYETEETIAEAPEAEHEAEEQKPAKRTRKRKTED